MTAYVVIGGYPIDRYELALALSIATLLSPIVALARH